MATDAIRHDGLVEFPIFEGLPPGDATDELLQALDLVTFDPDESFFREGDDGPDALFVILEGKVEIRREVPEKPSKVLATLEREAVLCETALLLPGPRTVSAVAVEPTAALCLTRDRFDWLVENWSPAAVVILRNIGKALANRLRLTNDEVIRLLRHVEDASPSEFEQFKSKLYGEWDF